MAAAQATLISPQAALDEGAVDGAELDHAAAANGLRVRRVSQAPADLLVSKAGGTLPFLLWRRSQGELPANEARVKKLAGVFKQASVLIPFELLGDAQVLDAACRLSCEFETLSVVWMPMGASFVERAVALALALQPAEAEEAAWRKQQAQTVASSEAVNQVLLGLPVPPDGDSAHHANMLRMLGSLQDISRRRADEIAAHTDLDGQTAAAIAAFFQRGGREPQAPAGLALPAQLCGL